MDFEVTEGTAEIQPRRMAQSLCGVGRAKGTSRG